MYTVKGVKFSVSTRSTILYLFILIVFLTKLLNPIFKTSLSYIIFPLQTSPG